MANRSVVVRLAAEVGNYVSGMKQAQSATDQLGNSTQKTAKSSEGAFSRLANMAQQNEQAWSTVSNGLIGVGTAAVAGAGLAVKKFADFDKAMSSVQAATHASSGEMDSLRDAAIRTGADTAFSAEEAARGIEELAKAGVSTGDILGGGLDGALALAAAGALDVGQAAEIAASAMTQFKMEGSEVGHIADLLAAGAGKAQGSVQDLGAALNQSGLVASQVGLSIEETVGGLAAFASAGLTGSDAGTSFKTMLQRLNPQSKEAAQMMEDLGLSAYDSQGNFIGLSEYAGKLQGALSGMSAEQRNAALSTLFGSDAVRAAAVLYEQGSAGVEKWENAVNDAGYAAETAAMMQDNLAGDLEKLGGAFDTVFLKAGSGPNEFLRGLVQGAESVVDAIGRIPAPVLSAGAAITGIAGAGMLVAGGLMKGIGAVAEFKGAMDTLGVSVDGAKGKMATFGKGLGFAAGLAIATKALIEFADQTAPTAAGVDEIKNALAGVPGDLDAVNASFANAEWANNNQEGMAGRLHSTVEGINGVGDALTKLQNLNWDESFSSWGNSVIGMEDPLNTMRDQIQSVDEAIAGMANSGNMEGAAEQFRSVMDSVRESGGDVQEAASQFDDYRASILDYASSLGVTLSEQETFQAMMGDLPSSLTEAAGGAEEAAAGIEGVGDAAAEAAPSLSEIVDSLSALGLTAVDSRSAIAGYEESVAALAEAAAAGGVALNQMGTDFDLTSESGRKASEAMGAVAHEGWAAAEGIVALGGGSAEAQASLQGTYDSLVTSAEQMGITGENATNLARELMGIPPEVSIESWMSDAGKQMAGETTAAVNEIPGGKSIDINASDGGTVGQVQGAINALHGKEIKAVVTDSGTVQLTQAQINAIYGKTTKVEVTDQGTVFHTQGKINGVTDGDATIVVGENGVATVQGAINSVQGKTVYIDVVRRNFGGAAGGAIGAALAGAGKAMGGRAPDLAGIPAAATGMRLPTTGPGTNIVDGILGIASNGMPRVRVDAGEWITNRRSSDKYDTALAMINADHPAVQHLAGLASGGRAEYVPPPVVTYQSAALGGAQSVQIDYEQLANAMSRVQITSPVSIGRREAARVVQVGRENLRGR